MFTKQKLKNEIEPEEMLLDRETAAKLETPLKKGGFFIIFALAVFVLLTFWSRAFWLNVIKGGYYAQRSSKNNIRLYNSRAPRGIIYDRAGKPLVENIPNFSLFIIAADLPKKDEERQNLIKRLSKIIGKDEAEVADFIKNLNQTSTSPVSLDLKLNRETLIDLEAHLPELPAIFINKETRRNYKNDYYFAPLLGYTGKVSTNNLKTDNYYSLLDYIGKIGLEAQYEKELRGTSGKIAVSVDSNNTVLNTLIAEEPAPGDNLILNIDGELQKLLTDALSEKMADTGSSAAAAVVINPKSGEILSLVSLPSFNNNLFNSDLSNKTYNALISDKRKPFFNRAISGAYASGSTIKPFMAAAALNENVVSPDYQVDDTLGYITIPNQYNPDISYIFHDWKAHGFVDMRRAIAVSANVYFYTIGGGYKNIKGLGIDRIDKYLKLFGFGSPLGIDLPGETGGLVPSPEWKKSVKKENWFTGDTYNVSIGQGDVLVTPLQLTAAISAIASDGILYKPRIVSKITDTDGKTIKEFKPEIIRSANIDKEKLQIVKEGMRQAVTEGSVYFLKDLAVKVAGKTGTAQVTNTFRKTNAWFTGFAPYDNPEIALSVIIEGAGEGSSAAVPVARRVFEWYSSQAKNVVK